MVSVVQTEVTVQGDIGGVGISRFTWNKVDATAPTDSDCDLAASAAAALFTAAAGVIPPNISWSVNPVFKQHNAVTGALETELTAFTLPADVVGTGTADYAAGVGMRIFWHTATVVNRRLVRGALFLVPVSKDAYAADGSLTAGSTEGTAGAANDYIATMEAGGLQPLIWSRPTTKTSADGFATSVTAATVSRTPAGLRSRRK